MPKNFSQETSEEAAMTPPIGVSTFHISYQNENSPTVAECCTDILNELRDQGLCQVILEDERITLQRNLQELKAILTAASLSNESFKETIYFKEAPLISVGGINNNNCVIILTIWSEITFLD